MNNEPKSFSTSTKSIKQTANHTAYLKRQKSKKKEERERLLGGIFIFLVSFLLVCIIAVICIGCSHSYREPDKTDEHITLDVFGEITSDTLSSFLIDNVLYVDFTAIALECDLVVTGTDRTQTFTCKKEDKNEYIQVTADEKTAVINGESVQMPAKAVLKGDSIWLSASFVSHTVNGISIKFDESNSYFSIKRNELNASTPSNPKYEPITFSYWSADPMDTIVDIGFATGDTLPPSTTEQPPIENEPQTFDFLLDLSEYEKYMEPENRDGYLIIANRDNLLSSSYVPEDLMLVYKAAGTADKYKMTRVAAMAFEALVKEASANGIKITARSGYRSYQTQYSLFNNYLNGHIKNDGMSYEQAFAYTLTYSQIAGASEHQTGLTMDVNTLEESFGATKEGKWLANNCYKFGFIIRYPKDKTDITGISWEPWHIRYVGRYHATKMHELNMCLEEYLEYLENNR